MKLIAQLFPQAKHALIVQLQDALAKATEEMKSRIERGQKKVNDLSDKIDDLMHRLKDKHAELGGKFKDTYQKLKGLAKKHISDILSKWAGRTVDEWFHREKRSLREMVDVHIQEEQAAEKLCNAFLRVIPEKKKEEISKLCKDHVTDFVAMLNKWLANGSSRTKRGANEIGKAIKDFFRDIKITYNEKYADFAEWLKTSYKNALEKANGRHEKLKAVAEEAKKKMHEMKEETVNEVMDALKPYKKELGSLWDELKEEVKNTFKKKE